MASDTARHWQLIVAAAAAGCRARVHGADGAAAGVAAREASIVPPRGHLRPDPALCRPAQARGMQSVRRVACCALENAIKRQPKRVHAGALTACTCKRRRAHNAQGERDARSAWNLYRSGRDLSEAVPQGDCGGPNPKFTVSPPCIARARLPTVHCPRNATRVAFQPTVALAL